MEKLDEILEFLDKNAAFLATKGTCGNPRVRPIQSALWHSGRLYFCTSREKNMWKHMEAHPGVELSAYDGASKWLRIRGEARLVEHNDVKEAMFAKYPLVASIYGEPSNPSFAVFYIENPSVKIQDFNGRNEVVKL